MDLQELAAQFGGKPVDAGSSDLAAQFGGVPVQQASPDADLAKQFGGVPVPVAAAPEEPKKEEPKKNEKPSLLAGTTLPSDIGPMGNRDITEVGTPLPGTRDLPKIDASKIPREWGVGETLLQSAKVGIPQLLQGFSTTGFRANADIVNKIDSVEQQLAAGKKNFTIEEDPLGVASMTPEQRAKFRTDTLSALGNRAAGVAQRQAEIEAIPQNPIVQKVMGATKGLDFKDSAEMLTDAFKKDPVQFAKDTGMFISAIGPSSAIANAPGVVAAIPAAIAGGPGAGAAVMGVGSFATDYASSILQGLAENGVDIKNPEALKAAAQNKELMDKVGKQAFSHASAVGVVDALSAGVASKVPLPKKVVKALENKPVAREVTNIALQSPIQGTLGASGEALGQIASGQQLDWGSIAAEFAGEFFGAPIEVAAVSSQRIKEAVDEKLDQRAEEKGKVNEEQAYKTAMGNILEAKGFVFSSPEEKQAVVDTIATETEATGDKESRFTSLLNKLKDFNAAKEEEVASIVDSIKQKFMPGKAEAEEPLSEVSKFLADAQTRHQESGFSRTDAERLANEDAKEAGYGDRTIAGARELSVSTPDQTAALQGATPGAAGTESGGMGGIGGTPGATGVGTEVQRGALDVPQNLVDLYAKSVAADEANSVSSTPANKRNATMAARRFIEAKASQLGLTKEDYLKESDSKAIRALDDAINTAYDQQQKTPTEATGAPLPAPVVTKGKAGRPKAVLTPEEAAAKAEVRKQSQAGTRDAIRTAERAQKTLSQVAPDPLEFESVEAAQLATDEYNNTRRQALEDAYALSVAPAHRNNKAGTVAKALLENATPQERELAKNRYEVRQKLNAPSRAEIVEYTNGEDNSKYESFNNAKSALNWLVKNGNEFEQALARRLAPYLNGVKLVVVDSHLDLPSKSLQNSMDGAVGLYVAGRNTIYLLRNGGINNTVFLHEALHGATVKRINSYLQAKLEGRPIPNDLRVAVAELYETMDEAKQLYDTLKAQGMLSDEMAAIPYNAFTDIKEFVSYGLTLPAMQEFLALAPGEYLGEQPGVISKLFTRFVQSLRKMFNMGEDHKSALQDLIIITDKLLRVKEQEVSIDEEANAAKKVNKKTKKVDRDLEKIRLSNDAFTTTGSIGDIIREGHSFEDYKVLLNAKFASMSNEFINKLLYGLQTVDILRWKGDEIPGLNEVDTLQQEMAAMRTHMLNASAKKGDRLGTFIRKNGMTTLGNTMHLARLKKVSPTKAPDAATYIAQDPIIQNYNKMMADPNTTPEQKTAYKGKITQRTNDINIVYTSWEALGKQKGGHEMYNMVRQFYIDNYTATRTLLNDQLNALPIDDDAKEKLLKSVRLMHEQAKKGADDDFDGMDVQALPEEYFPFKREGKYWLRVDKGPTGRELWFFENGTARNLFLAKRAKELGQAIDDPNFSAGDDITSLRQNFQDSSIMLQKMFASIDEATTDPKFDTSKYASAEEASRGLKEELKDQLYQVYLMTLPERSFRKQFLHAENITGFSADVFRNFKTSATAFANQLAKLKYGTDITNSIQRARDSLQGMPAIDRAKLELFVNEIGRRAQEEIDPPETGKMVTAVNQFAFIMLLTSAASAATQMASVPIMVMPSLNAAYGYGASAKAFAKYFQIWKSIGVTEQLPNGDVNFTAPSIGSSQMLKDNPILQRAFEAALDRHVTTLTNTSVLTNRNRTPDNSYASIPGVATRVGLDTITALFNGSERMSRELTFMMTFELEYAKTKDFDASVNKAVDTTHELLGRYDNFNRPRILRNAFGKTVGQFKQYAVFMTSFFMRNMYEIVRVSTPIQERAEALHRLAGVLVMGGMFHGLVGFPMYSVICATIDAFFDGDEEEKKARRAKNPFTADDSNLRFRYDWLPQHFGQIEITGLDKRKHRLSDLLEKGPISALTDINIGSRTSFDGMWFRAAKPGKNYLETAQNYMIANLGPGVSTGFNMFGAIDNFNNGQIDRGLEKLVPAFFKGSLVANRLAKEGAETIGGADMLKPKEINTLNLIAATMGFQSTRLARIQEGNFESQKQQTEAQNQRAKILKRLDETVLDVERGPKDLKVVFNQIREYNKRYPAEKLLIDADTINNSLKAYAEKRGLTYRGAYMDKKLIPYLMPLAKAAAPLE